MLDDDRRYVAAGRHRWRQTRDRWPNSAVEVDHVADTLWCFSTAFLFFFFFFISLELLSFKMGSNHVFLLTTMFKEIDELARCTHMFEFIWNSFLLGYNLCIAREEH